MSNLRKKYITDELTGVTAEVNAAKQLEVNAAVEKTYFTQNPDGTKREVTTQNPLPVSDGLVCANDLWVSESVMNDFDGVVTDLFDNLHTVITDNTTNNPKEILIHFSGTIIANLIGVGAFINNGGKFSNLEIQTSLSDGVFTTVVDESTDSTIKYSAQYSLPNIGINAMKLIFHTTNDIVISNLIIPKLKNTVARIQGIDQDGVGKDVRVTEVGNMMTTNFLIEVARGNIPGYSSINKFGHNPAVPTGGADIWSGLGVYGFFPTVAQSMELVSTSALDTSGGTGATSFQVYGLDLNWEEIEETVIPNGTTAVALANTYIRMYRVVNLTAGSNETNVGNISVQISGGGTVGAYIGAGDGQTQQAIYTIPAGKSGFFIKGYVALANANKNGEDGTFQWVARPNTMANGAWATKGEMSLVNIGSSHWQYEYGIASGPIPEKTDVKLRMTTASATMDTVGGFDILLIDD